MRAAPGKAHSPLLRAPIWLQRAGLIRKLPEDNLRDGFYGRAGVETFIAALLQGLHDFTRRGFLTGWREGEIASLRWADVEREAGSLRLSWQKTKTTQARTIPSPPSRSVASSI